MERPSLVRTSLAVLPAQIDFRVGEAALPVLLAYWFGIDLYYFAWAFFTFAGTLDFSAFQDSVLVPILAEERLLRREGLPRLRGAFLAYAWLLGGALALGMGLLALVWFGARYEGEELALAARLVPPFCLYLVAVSTRTFFGTLLVVERRFVPQPIASGLGMAANLGIIALGHEALGVALLPVAALAGELVAIAVLAWVVVRGLELRIHLCLDRPPALLRFGRLVASQVGGSAVTRINPVVDQMMASFAGFVGAGAILRNAGDVALLPTSLLQATLLPVLLSHLSEDFASGDHAGARRTVVRALGGVSAVLGAATAILWLVRGPLLRVVFLRGEMDAAGVDKMIALFPYYLVGLVPFGALLVLARAHIALKNSRIMLSMGVVNAACNALFDAVLLKVIGLEGIALATSAMHTVVAVVFWFRFEARITALAAAKAAPAEEPSADAKVA